MPNYAEEKILQGLRVLWWKKENGEIIHNSPEQITDLDALPMPNMKLLDMDFYTQKGVQSVRGHFLSSACILTSRGCLRRCDFCCESLTYGRGVRCHSPEYVVEWITQLLQDYSIQGIYFHDNDFLFDEVRARKICQKMISEGLHKRIKWAIQARADHINPDILRLLKKAGCVNIEIGIESSLQDQLDQVHKGTTVNKNESAIALCQKAGITVHAYMMTGFEGETLAHLQQMLEWLKRVRPDTFNWLSLMIHPGTSLYRERGNEFFENNEWDEQQVISHYSKDSLSCIPQEIRQAWMKKYYAPYESWCRRCHILKTNRTVDLIRFMISERDQIFPACLKAFEHLINAKQWASDDGTANQIHSHDPFAGH